MLYGFFGRVSSAPKLLEGLDASSQRLATIGQRVAAARARNESGFALPAVAGAGGDAIDLEAEMTALADEDLRNQALNTLLRGTYDTLRSVIRDRG
jgi:flagellar basal body rod protein FlgB